MEPHKPHCIIFFVCAPLEVIRKRFSNVLISPEYKPIMVYCLTRFIMSEKAITNPKSQTVSMVLCFIRIFLCISFSIIGFSLIFYTGTQLHLSTESSTALVGAVFALNSLLYFVSGYIGGKYITNRHLLLLSVSLLLMSCFFLSFENITLLPLCLAIFVAGNGLESTCINNIITHMFKNNDAERERAFYWNYSGMNLGFFIGLSLSGWFLIDANYKAIFLSAGISAIIAMTVFLWYWKYFKESLSNNISKAKSHSISYATIGGSLLMLLFMFKHPAYGNQTTFYLGIAVFATSFFLMMKICKGYAYNILSFYFLALVTLIFWMIFQIGPMALMVFIDKNVDLVVLGIKIAPQWLLNVNTLSIVIGGPLFSWAIKALRAKGFVVSDYTLFAIAMICMGSSFLILPIAITWTNTGMVNMGWIVVTFLLQSTGELCLAPIGFSLTGKLIPSAYQSRHMGIWMMIFGLSSVASAYFSKLMLVAPTDTGLSDSAFSHWFLILGSIAVGAALVVYFLSFVMVKKIKLISKEGV